MLLVSFRRDGRPVPTPVWFASASNVLYARSEADAGKIKRIRRDSRVLVAPCDGRGRPLGPAHDAKARVLASDETLVAETALAGRYGVTRRIVERLFFRGRQFAYLEVRLTSDAAFEQGHTGDR
jgi:PPOX class probable F420-dependent enzyme